MSRIVAVFLTTLALGACSEKVSESHQSYAAAAASGLFERGWLPAYIPQSSFEISTKNDLDANTAEGSFRFKPGDAESFLGHLERVESREPSRGYVLYTQSYWRFWVNAEVGHARFELVGFGG